jgi:hypothetical protein
LAAAKLRFQPADGDVGKETGADLLVELHEAFDFRPQNQVSLARLIEEL